jgi:DNA integrity scanning protein DisA with diadenylate cyclase activity
MIVTANNDSDVCLLILKKEKSIVPVALSAFHVSQSSRKKIESYNGALVVTSDGSARVIRKIDVLNFWGETVGRKIISVLTGAHQIAVQFDDVSIGLEEFKSLIEDYVSIDSKKGDPFLPQEESLSNVFERVKNSKSFEEVFNNINIPPVEDCLDVL